MKFNFRLEKILHFVRVRESMKKMEVSALTHQVRYLEDRCVRLSKNIRELLDLRKDPVASDWSGFCDGKIEMDSRSLASSEGELRKVSEELEQRRYELMSITMRRKGFEALRSQREREFNVAQNRREQKHLDELYSLNNAGKRAEGAGV